MKRVLITGASGYIGSALTEKAIKSGCIVHCLDVNIANSSFEGVEKSHSIDLTDNEAVAVLFQKYAFDVVFHLAAIAGISDSKITPFNAIQVNIIGTATVLEAIRLYAPKTQIIYASTVYVHSNHGSIYAATKKCCELLIEKYAEEYNINYTFLRFGSVYGPGANDFNFVHNTLLKAIAGEELIYDGTGDEVREYIHINDAADLAFRVVGSEFYGNSYMITGSQKIRIRDLFDLISEIMNRKLDYVFKSGVWDGHYKRTPYSYDPKISRRLVPSTEIDLAGGIFESLKSLEDENIES